MTQKYMVEKISSALTHIRRKVPIQILHTMLEEFGWIKKDCTAVDS